MEEPMAGTVELKWEWAVNSWRGWLLWTEDGPWMLAEWREDAGGREKEGFWWPK